MCDLDKLYCQFENKVLLTALLANCRCTRVHEERMATINLHTTLALTFKLALMARAERFECSTCNKLVPKNNAARHARSSRCVTLKVAAERALAVLERKRARDREWQRARRVAATNSNDQD